MSRDQFHVWFFFYWEENPKIFYFLGRKISTISASHFLTSILPKDKQTKNTLWRLDPVFVHTAMSAPFQRIQQNKSVSLPGNFTPEQRYWRGFKNPILVKENNAINHIHFNPQSPHDFAVTSSTRVQIFSAKTRQVVRTIARFTDTVYSGEFRSDGKLVVAGDATGLIQVFDANSRSILVKLQPTQHPTHVTKFHPSSLTTLLSASDDKVARLWDITSPNPIASFDDHTDYIRTGCFIPSSNLIATGSYDSVVRLYDSRAPPAEGPISQHDQGAPVESIVALNPTTLVSAGGPTVKVWDLTAGKTIKTLSNFQKTVTTLSDGGPHGLLAGSLDGHVKVFDYSSGKWDVKFGWKYGGGVLNTGISPDQKHLVTGLTSGLLSIRTRKTEPRVAQGVKKERTSASARLMKGIDYHGELEHRVVEDNNKTKKKLPLWERYLRQFRWADALDSVLCNDPETQNRIPILEEIRKRGKIRVSLAGRDEASLEPLFKYLIRYTRDNRTLPVAADFLACAIEMYGPLIEKSGVLESRVNELRTVVLTEINVAQNAQRIEGMLELLADS